MTQSGRYTLRTIAAKADVPNGWLELQFYQTSLLMLGLLTILFFIIMTVLSGIGAFTFQNPVARKKARIIFGISFLYIVVVVVMLLVVVHTSVAAGV